MKLHTVFITYNRLELSKQAIFSYKETVTVPHTLIVVDNASEDESKRWLQNSGLEVLFLAQNFYPGYACNRGWELAPYDATHLHRADNDFLFLDGWCEQVEKMFKTEKIGQVGLRTNSEEQFAKWNVGGNCVIRRELWDRGLRYDETPWPEIQRTYGVGFSEDSLFSPQVVEMGYTWKRVKNPAIRSLASGDWSDNYYIKSYGDRGITPNPDDPAVPGTR